MANYYVCTPKGPSLSWGIDHPINKDYIQIPTCEITLRNTINWVREDEVHERRALIILKMS